jgi:serine protease DegS
MASLRLRLSEWGWPVAAGLFAALLILHFLPVRQTMTAPRAAAPVSWADAVQRASPAVVNIYTSRVVRQRYPGWMDNPLVQQLLGRSPAPMRERVQRSLGSGVIMTGDGYLLTNLHVISGATGILVLLADGRESLATVLGTDPDTDLAVLHIELPDLQPISIGNPEKAEVGDVVLAIGNPYGFARTVTQGIISATGRFGLQLNVYENYIQTDAAINPGNSGGALVDANGNLLGINTAIYSPTGGSQGIGLAIPADVAVKVLRDIVAQGHVIRGWLGVAVQPLAARLQSPEGPVTALVVSDVESGSPAEQAGLKPGDLLLGINGKPIEGGRQAMQRIALMAPGERFDLEVLRDDQPLRLEGTVGERTAP